MSPLLRLQAIAISPRAERLVAVVASADVEGGILKREGEALLWGALAAQTPRQDYTALWAGVQKRPPHGLAWIRPYLKVRRREVDHVREGKAKVIVELGGFACFIRLDIFKGRHRRRSLRPAVCFSLSRGGRKVYDRSWLLKPRGRRQ